MKVTLVFPGIFFTGFGSRGTMVGTESEYMNHGLGFISSSAKAKGHEVDLIDLRELQGWDEFEERILACDSPVIGISIMSNDYEAAKECCRRIRDKAPDKIVVAGGVHATVDTEDVAKNQDIDYIITGEGEVSFVDLLEKIDRREESPRVIQGISPDLETIPFADRELFDMSGELNLPWFNMEAPFVTINMARGCPFKCNFCQPAERSVFGGKVRRRSVAAVMKELEYLRERFKFRSFMVHDDLFTIDPRWVMEFCDEYERRGFKATFCCQMRVDLICDHEYMIKRLKEVGLQGALIGFESGSQRVLDFLEKATTVEQNLQAAEICHKYGIEIFANTMFGIPGETNEEALMTARMVRSLGEVSFAPSFFMPYKGAGLYDYVKANGLLKVDSIVYGDYDRAADNAREILHGVDYPFLHDLIDRLRHDKPIPDVGEVDSLANEVSKPISLLERSVVMRPLARLLKRRPRENQIKAAPQDLPIGKRLALYQDISDSESLRGKSFFFGCWVKCDVPGTAFLAFHDGVVWMESKRHSGKNRWEYLTIRGVVSSEASLIRAHLYMEKRTTADFEQASLSFDARQLGDEGNLKRPNATIQQLSNGTFELLDDDAQSPIGWELGGEAKGRISLAPPRHNQHALRLSNLA